MWAVSPIEPRSILPLIPKATTNTKPPLTVSATFHPKNSVISSENIGGLRHNLISALNSSPNNTPNPIQEKQKQEGRELSGSDVLWALQRAATHKNKKNTKKKKRELSSVGGNKEDDAVDYNNIRPLCIKSEWGVKLNELEKRLQELSDFT